jgi:hypothetical protein
MTTIASNIPVRPPRFRPDLAYGSDDAEAVSVLVEADEGAVHGSDARGALGRVLATLEMGRELTTVRRTSAAE